jgi:hypothetical protein
MSLEELPTGKGSRDWDDQGSQEVADARVGQYALVSVAIVSHVSITADSLFVGPVVPARHRCNL